MCGSECGTAVSRVGCQSPASWSVQSIMVRLFFLAIDTRLSVNHSSLPLYLSRSRLSALLSLSALSLSISWPRAPRARTRALIFNVWFRVLPTRRTMVRLYRSLNRLFGKTAVLPSSSALPAEPTTAPLTYASTINLRTFVVSLHHEMSDSVSWKSSSSSLRSSSPLMTRRFWRRTRKSNARMKSTSATKGQELVAGGSCLVITTCQGGAAKILQNIV